MVNNYTFAKKYTKKSSGSIVWYCSSRLTKQCQAMLEMDKDGNFSILNECHNHEPPKYLNINGKYIKM